MMKRTPKPLQSPSGIRNAEKKEIEKIPRTIRYKTCYRNTVHDALKGRGWKESDSDEWDIMWGDKEWMKEVFDTLHLGENQRVNHFRNHFELTRKDNLIKNLKRMKRQLEKEDKQEEVNKYNFFPPSYLLPAEYAIFLEEWKRHPPGTFWIMKPIAKAQGKGIFLFNKLSQISNWKKDYKSNVTFLSEETPQAEAYVVQRYLDNPYLIGGKKFDLRIYALVMSYNPLKVFLHRSAFARMSNHRYSMDINDMSNTYVHLTNVAVQRTSKSYNSAGTKWNVKNLKLYLISKHGLEAVNELFSDIQNVILRSLMSVQKVMIHDKHCFELYGYDILIDNDLKPWLLEVNASPSLSADTEADHTLKYGVLDDVFTTVDFEHKLKGDEEHIGGFDLIYDQATGFRRSSCYLGCYVKPPVIKVPKTLGKKPQSAQSSIM